VVREIRAAVSVLESSIVAAVGREIEMVVSDEVRRGEELRDEGIARAAKGNPVFFDLALGAIRRVAEKDVFTTDDVWV
jgi:hypothetical protein